MSCLPVIVSKCLISKAKSCWCHFLSCFNSLIFDIRNLIPVFRSIPNLLSKYLAFRSQPILKEIWGSVECKGQAQCSVYKEITHRQSTLEASLSRSFLLAPQRCKCQCSQWCWTNIWLLREQKQKLVRNNKNSIIQSYHNKAAQIKYSKYK